MRSNKSNDSHAVEVNGIRIEISNPHLMLFPTRVYPIPKNQLGVTVPIKLAVRIVNNTSHYFRINPFQPFTPEFLTSDEQIIQGHLVTKESVTSTQLNKVFENNQTTNFPWWSKVKPGFSTILSLTTTLSKQNNLLQLKVPTTPNCPDPNTFWCFEPLGLGTYKLRFILNTYREITSISESDIRQEGTVLLTHEEILATPWVNLRLVQPLSTDSSAIEVDGVQFKVEKPSSVLWTTPPIQTGAKTDVKLGIHVTNNTSTAFRFYQTGSVDATLIDDYGKEINFSSDPVRLQLSHEPKYYLVQPGESAFFNLDGILFWDDGQFQLAIPNKSRHCFTGSAAFYYFHNLKLGTSYHLQLIYHVSEWKAKRLQENALLTVWNGWIAMPFVEFCLVEP